MTLTSSFIYKAPFHTRMGISTSPPCNRTYPWELYPYFIPVLKEKHPQSVQVADIPKVSRQEAHKHNLSQSVYSRWMSPEQESHRHPKPSPLASVLTCDLLTLWSHFTHLQHEVMTTCWDVNIKAQLHHFIATACRCTFSVSIPHFTAVSHTHLLQSMELSRVFLRVDVALRFKLSADSVK